ncbi:MAG TPA: DUF1622 domain-containing protein [Polymorphobacter sp.]|nr:DUF1622 domain-containing protein [Polymorphobacter sp.]
MIEVYFREIAAAVALAIEAAVVLVVAIGAAEAMFSTCKLVLGGKLSNEGRRDIWLRFAIWILLALEFALASDIIRTAIAPSWDDVGKLGAIAAIRTGLNWFLAKDIEEYSTRKAGERSEKSGITEV